ncbi:MAG TPA: hypothetical protein VN803_03000, partial [Gemmatimonadales bacterium]|nr:hypothetical protein [Gemmatimonadales bacterium]
MASKKPAKKPAKPPAPKDLERAKRLRALKEQYEIKHRDELLKTSRKGELTYAVISDRTGVGERAVAEWFAGGGFEPENLIALAALLETTPDYIDPRETGMPSIQDEMDEIRSDLNDLSGHIRALEHQIVFFAEQLRELIARLPPRPSEDVEPQTFEEAVDELKSATRAVEGLAARLGERIGRRALESRR